jgi:hypothetical protein
MLLEHAGFDPQDAAADQKRDRTEQTSSKVEAASREANKEKTMKEIDCERRAAAENGDGRQFGGTHA